MGIYPFPSKSYDTDSYVWKVSKGEVCVFCRRIVLTPALQWLIESKAIWLKIAERQAQVHRDQYKYTEIGTNTQRPAQVHRDQHKYRKKEAKKSTLSNCTESSRRPPSINGRRKCFQKQYFRWNSMLYLYCYIVCTLRNYSWGLGVLSHTCRFKSNFLSFQFSCYLHKCTHVKMFPVQQQQFSINFYRHRPGWSPSSSSFLSTDLLLTADNCASATTVVLFIEHFCKWSGVGGNMGIGGS